MRFRQAMNRPADYQDWLDYDSNGTIDILDYKQLKLRMNRSILV